MKQLLQKCDIYLDNNKLGKLRKFHNLIYNRNQEYNLTGILNFNEIIIKHYVDCFIVNKLIDISFPLLDIGTGAGFPGIPLKILFEEEEIILAEPRKERVSFLKEVKKELGLKNTSIYPHKINHDFKIKVNSVITRALEPIVKTLERISSCLEEGGLAVFMKGPSVDKEIKLFNKLFGKEYHLIKNHPYVLPLLNHHRRLVVVKRESGASYTPHF